MQDNGDLKQEGDYSTDTVAGKLKNKKRGTNKKKELAGWDLLREVRGGPVFEGIPSRQNQL
jgi:hypothetical protein